jgi:hypothetical protein
LSAPLSPNCILCVLPGVAILAKRWGWRIALLVEIVYVPFMTIALVYILVSFADGI